MGLKKFGLLGYPLSHSLSPFIHSSLLELKGIDGEYRLFEIGAELLPSEFESKLKLLNGFNVTIPHKTEIIRYIDKLSERAELYGSVNTVKTSGGEITGYNTDYKGFLKSLELSDISLGGRALVCGCGGVSRMFAAESIIKGAEVTLGIREESRKKAEALRSELKSKLGGECKIALLSEIKTGFDIIINGTPVGMYPNISASPVNCGVIKKSCAVFDAVYNPYKTALIKTAQEYGIPCLNGLAMLVIQAAAAEEIWNGVKFSDGEIKTVIGLTEEELLKNE